MRRIVFVLLLMAGFVNMSAEEYTLTSPDGKLKIGIQTDEVLTWEIEYDGTTVILPSGIWMETDKGDFGLNMEVEKTKEAQVSESFDTPFYKKASVKDEYKELILKCDGYRVVFRAYNDGAAYRFESDMKELTVTNENAFFNFEGDYKAFIPYINDNRGGERWCYSFESYYDEQPLSKMYKDSLAITPLAVCLPNGKKAVVMDAGVENYPGMFLLKGEDHALKAAFAPYPLETAIGGHARLNLVPTLRADYIAKAEKDQVFPWRAVVVTNNDGDLLNCDMAQRLAPKCRIKDTSWIKPGKVAWDWWNNTNLTGVDFEAGINTETYKYFIDFAKRNGLEYIIIDEGWSSPESLMILSKKIDLLALVQYAKERGIGIILWSSWRNMIGKTAQDNINNVSLNNAKLEFEQPADSGKVYTMDEVMAHYQQMGIKGFKVDFFDRDDQEVIRSAYEVAECAARHHLLLDLHGLKPFGIQRAYPNIVNFEGVKGLENSKWEPRKGDGPLHDQPRYDVTAPFLRMLPGPMDYTPGAMSNATRDQFFGNNNHPMSQGTRVHQMAMYTIFEAPLQMLADSPTRYEKEQECTDFISKIPTTFDETVVLDAKIGEYILLARRKGATWYLAAMTNWVPRDLTVDLSLLPSVGGDHKSSSAVIFADGINAHRDATDYKRSVVTVTPGQKLDIHLAPGGGWTAIVDF